MKITDVKFIPLVSLLKEPIKLALGTITHRYFGLVKIDTDEGITGIGETSVNFPPWAIIERKATIERGVRSLLIGEDPLQIEKLWEKMYRGLIRYGLVWGKGAIMQAISGADIALWDIAGKAKSLPVFQLLGGLYKDKIELYATGFSLENPVKGVLESLKKGYKAVKLRIGFNQKADLEMIKLVKENIGEDIKLMVDANMAWGAEEALNIASKLEPYNLYWIEEPVRCDEIETMAYLAEKLSTPLAAGENAFGRENFRLLITKKAADVIMPDVTRSGGLTECRKICSIASAWNIPYSPHHYGSDVGFAATLHLMASTPGGLIMLRDVSKTPLRDEILLNPIKIINGITEVPKGLGLGIELNEDLVSKHLYQEN